MRWCTQCRRYAVGYPRYCPTCGRTFGVRWCRRGHTNRRDVAFCTDCGSDELSTPAPPEPWMHAVVHRIPAIGLPILVMGFLAAVGIGMMLTLDWARIMPLLVGLGILYGGWHWLGRRIPAPVRRLGTTAARRLWRAVRMDEDYKSRRR